jgi:hypothetical protein
MFSWVCLWVCFQRWLTYGILNIGTNCLLDGIKGWGNVGGPLVQAFVLSLSLSLQPHDVTFATTPFCHAILPHCGPETVELVNNGLQDIESKRLFLGLKILYCFLCGILGLLEISYPFPLPSFFLLEWECLSYVWSTIVLGSNLFDFTGSQLLGK